jgi:hypothetical protein
VSKKYSEDIQKLLRTVVDEFDDEDQDVRERQIIQWKKLNYMWEGFQRLWWSEIAHDWRVYDEARMDDMQNAHYDKPINVYRAFLETIISALSQTVPSLIGMPDDADNINDVLTAKAASKITELVYKHNDAPLLWVHALFIFCNQGMIAAYNYPDEDESYGTHEEDKYEQKDEEVDTYVCELCKNELEGPELEQAIMNDLDVSDEFMPTVGDPEDPASHILCPYCKQLVQPQQSKRTISVNRFVGTTSKAKTRQCIEVYGGLNIKVANYAKCQSDTPYLRFSKEQHYSQIFEEYPDLRGKEKEVSSSSNGTDLYEVWGRLSPQYNGAYPINTPTVNKWWLRPSSFNILQDEEDRNLLLKEFPKGAHIVYVNDVFAMAAPAALDDCWTITENPLSEFLHFDPLGNVLVSVQEITNDLISLILQTIEHGIPQTFADPKVLNFEQYKNTPATPGMIFPAKSGSGKTLNDGFYTTKTATLSQEVMPFGEKIQELGQFTSGALPSLYGGDQSNSSRTAAQYSMSKESSLQRLQVTWKMLNFWWKNVFGKVVPAYIKTIVDDENLVEYQNGSYINTAIKKAELSGKLGSIELESSDQLPFTYGQKRDVIISLMQSTNPQVLEALGHPNNIPIIAEALGLKDFVIPGEADREKQFEEIQILLKTQPTPGQQGIDPMTGQPLPPQEMPSVMPDFDLDNHEVEYEICRNWLVGEAGRQAKSVNELGYKNVLLHMKAHKFMMSQEAAMAMPQEGANGADQSGEEPVSQGEPVLNPNSELANQ